MKLEWRININSGMALVLYILTVAGLLVGTAFSPAIAGVFLEAGGLITVGFAGYLKKRDANNKNMLKIELEELKGNGNANQPGNTP